MSVEILGTLQVRSDADVSVPTPRLARILLGMLALRANRPVTADAVRDALWAGRPPKSAAANLRGYVAELRRLLASSAGSPTIEVSRAGYCLRAPVDAVDAVQFVALAAEGRRLLAASRYAESAVRLTSGLELWRGPAFAGEAVPEALLGEVQALEMRRQAAVEDQVDARLALGGHRELGFELTVLVSQWPLCERLSAQLMLALYRSGRQVESIAAYHGLRRRLDEELGVLPSTDIQQLYRRILHADPALDVDARELDAQAVPLGFPRPQPHFPDAGAERCPHAEHPFVHGTAKGNWQDASALPSGT